MPKEMGWTVASFQYNEEKWKMRAERYQMEEKRAGHCSYALKQAAMWRLWGERANFAFYQAMKSNVE